MKRVILIGDHQQLPPLVQNLAFQKYSHLDQSLFTRFARLGTHFVELNAQGRARPSLVKLFNWSYNQLDNLPVVLQNEFNISNPGFVFDYQFIDVPNFQGESEPSPYFYQNLIEAEYLVSVYQYMRLLGYPARKVVIITAYNGQKALLRDVIEKRCNNPLFGKPYKVTSVDKFQGQQNDYVLFSLVKTRSSGHIRDFRRLVVSMSRARLGIYIFGSLCLFTNCYEIRPTLEKLLARPTTLALLPDEIMYTNNRRFNEILSEYVAVSDLLSMAHLIVSIVHQNI